MPNRSKTSTSKHRAAQRGRGRLSVTSVPTLAPLDASRPFYWRRLRSLVNAWYQTLPLPDINPDYVSFASLVVAFLFVVAVGQNLQLVAWIFLVVHLFLDGLDGAIAKRYQSRRTRVQQEHGVLADVVVDRAAEGILFVIPPFFWPWFPLFLLNSILAVLTIRRQQALILPLRIAFFIVFTVSLFR